MNHIYWNRHKALRPELCKPTSEIFHIGRKKQCPHFFLLPHSIRSTCPRFWFTTLEPFQIFRSVHKGNRIALWPIKKRRLSTEGGKKKDQKSKVELVNGSSLVHLQLMQTHTWSHASVAGLLMWFGITGPRFLLNAPIFLPPSAPQSPSQPLLCMAVSGNMKQIFSLVDVYNI